MKTIAAVLLLLAAATEPAPVKGTLCFGRDCRAVEGTTIEFAPSDTPRPFVWTSADGKTVVAGIAAAKATSVDVAAKELQTVSLSVRGSAARGWPAETTLSIKGQPKGTEWTVAIPAKRVESLTTLRLPPNTYAIAISAPHHQGQTRRIKADGSVNLREIALKPSPVVSGRTVAHDEKGNVVPVAGTQFTRDGKIAGSSNEQGAFRVELADPLPKQLLAVHPGYGTKVLPIADHLPPDTDLGAVELGAARSLTVHIVLPPGIDPKSVHVQLYADTRGVYQMASFGTQPLTASESDVVFHDIAPGNYLAIVAGASPLERVVTPLKVEDTDQKATLTVSPYRLQGTVKIGEQAMQEGAVGMSDRTGWHAEMPISGGQFGAVLWQTGVLRGFVRANEILQPVTSPELGVNPSTWDIVFPDRRISGRIFDAETKQPVEGVRLMYQRTTHGAQGYFQGQVQPDGTYSLLTVDDGTYELRVEAPGYLNDYTKFEVAADDARSQTHDFALSRGVKTTLEVVTASGNAIPGATVLEGVNSDGHNPDRIYGTDGSGRLTLQLRADEVRTLYILPLEGSLAIVHLRAARGDEPVRVVVPPPAGTLDVVIKKDDPKAFAVPVVRYNGEILPMPVTFRLGMRAPVEGRTRLAALPAGAYEIWGVVVPRGPAGYSPLIGYVPTWAPARVGLSVGESTVEVVPQPLH